MRHEAEGRWGADASEARDTRYEIKIVELKYDLSYTPISRKATKSAEDLMINGIYFLA